MTAGSENVDHDGVFQRAGAVFDAAADQKSISGADVECLTCGGDAQMAADHIHDLFVRVTVHGADPSLLHAVLGEEKLVVVRQNLTFEAPFGRGGDNIGAMDSDHIGG